MEAFGLLRACVLISFMVVTCRGSSSTVSFSSLQRTLAISASPKPGQLLKAGVDDIKITWKLNQTFPSGTDSTYKTLSVKLCYAPISQVDRGWRKTEDHISKDKTCQFDILSRPYSPSNTTNSWMIERNVPTATYFIRAYILNSAGVVVAYGQTTDAKKASNLFQIQAISGRHATLDICSVCFSVFSVVSLFAFFFIDKRKAKASQQK